MPTDIQVNDTLTYTEDTRKFGGFLESVRDGTFNRDDVDGNQAVNTTTIAAGAAALGQKLGNKGAALISGLVGFGAGDIFTAEAQRSLGR